MNNVNITGRITHDLDLRQTQSGKFVLDFQIAIRETKDITTFVRCQAWEKTAEIISQYAMKGSNLAISGGLKTDRYQDRSGNNVERTYIRVSTVEILDKRKEKLVKESNDYNANQEFAESLKGTEYEKQFGGNYANTSDIALDDLPFY